MAYSPLGSTGGPLLTAEAVVKTADKHGVKPSAVLLSYHSGSFSFSLFSPYKLQAEADEIHVVPRGTTVLAKSVTPERIQDNLNLVELDAEDVKLLDDWSQRLTAEGKLMRFVYPPFGVDFGFPDKS